MSKEQMRDTVKARHDLHDEQDRQLADKVGIGKMNTAASIDSKIPLRVTSNVAPGDYARKETVVKK